MDRQTVKTREQELEDLLRDAVRFLRDRGTYYYNTQRRGVAADLVDRIEKAIGY
jgi:hypothetical protein